MKKLMCILLALALVISLMPAALAADAPFAGSGTEADPYIISGAEDMLVLAALSKTAWPGAPEYFSAHYAVSRDIDMTDIAWSGMFLSTGDEQGFSGAFDGGGHAITGISDCLFGYISENGLVRDVNLESVDVSKSFDSETSPRPCFGLIADLCAGRIEGCSVRGVVSITYTNYPEYSYDMLPHAGGVAGMLAQGSIAGCVNYIDITTGGEYCAYTGGIVGSIYGGSVVNCDNYGALCAAEYGGGVGGIAGNCGYNMFYQESDIAMRERSLEGCANFGVIQASDNCGGGIAGIVYSSRILRCFNVGQLQGKRDLGGVAALAADYRYMGSAAPEITDCFNAGDFSGETVIASVGGIAAEAEGAVISRCYNVGAVRTGNANAVGGICPVGAAEVTDCYYIAQRMTDERGAAVSAGELRRQTTYGGFDFENVWKMEGGSYPFAKLRDLDIDGFLRLGTTELSIINKSTTQAEIKWAGVPGADAYVLMRYEHGGGKWENIRNTSLLSYTDSDMKPGKYYYYAIKAGSSLYGVSGGYGQFALTRGRPATPDKPALLLNKKGQISIKWSAAGESGIMYRVVRHEDGSGKGWLGVRLTNGTSYADTSVKSGKTYRYRVHAYKNIGGKNVFSCYSDAIVVRAK